MVTVFEKIDEGKTGYKKRKQVAMLEESRFDESVTKTDESGKRKHTDM